MWRSIRHAFGACIAAAALAGCGGGGSGSSGVSATPEAAPSVQEQPAPPAAAPQSAPAPQPAAATDPRNGDYPLYATSGFQALLQLDFDRQSWRIVGNGSDDTGALRTSTSDFEMRTADASKVLGHFILQSQTAVGGVVLTGNTASQSFIAPRVFVSLADAQGSYGTFQVFRQSPGYPLEAAVGSTARATISGSTLTLTNLVGGTKCGINLSAPITANGTDFAWNICGEPYPFRVARIGNDKVLLMASAFTGNPALPVMVAGLHERATFVAGQSRVNFTQGSGTDAWGDATITADAVHLVQTSGSGAPVASDSTFRQMLVTAPPVRWYDTPSFGQNEPWTYAVRTADITLMISGARINVPGSAKLGIGLPAP